ncbi:MAG: membrane protein insertase YidC, partial [Methylococcales bacterium]|nr:membrane protein insertase YidC [Methylococcales bacterium]
MDNIRFLLVVAFAMISYMLWEQWQLDYGPKPVVSVLEQPDILDSNEDLPIASNGQVGEVKQSVEAVPVLEIPSDKIIKVTTDVFSLEIDTKGGTIRNLDLLQHPHEKVNTVVDKLFSLVGLDPMEKDLSPIRLLNSDTEKLFLAQSGLIAGNGSATAPDHHASFTTEKDSYELAIGENSLSVPLV